MRWQTRLVKKAGYEVSLITCDVRPVACRDAKKLTPNNLTIPIAQVSLLMQLLAHLLSLPDMTPAPLLQ